MVEHALADDQVWQLTSFIRSMRRSSGSVASVPGLASIRVSAEELSATREPTQDWLTYSGSYSSTRHSALAEITPSNVGRLALKWIYQIPGDPGLIETTPLVRHGIMFATIPPAIIVALDATTGRLLWRFEHKVPAGLGGEFGTPLNRGVALLEDMVFIGTSDAKVLAVDARTGTLVWEVTISDDPAQYYVSSAPLAYGDLIVTGVGTRGGGRAFVVAYDARTGKERWRWIAVPGPGEAGNETWSGNSWREGGAPTWLTGSYDPELDLLVWAVGNPKPDYERDKREGDNLYSNSLVGLRGATGELLWHFQFTPADDHDWDANQIAVLARAPAGEGGGKRILLANRNGFYYVLDGVSGRFQHGAPFVHQTWAAGIDSTGRPVLAPNTQRTSKGTMLYPGVMGATNWWSPSFDQSLNLMFVPSLEQGMLYFNSASSWPTAQSGQMFYTAVRALNATTGALVWEHRNAPRDAGNTMGGLLSTATGVLFGGDLGKLFALDSRTGGELWSVETGGRIHAAPISFEAGGSQLVVIAAGRNVVAFGLPAILGQ
jgi:alcohol dehydrogenase (cytochrome c)